MKNMEKKRKFKEELDVLNSDRALERSFDENQPISKDTVGLQNMRPE
jgi:hypothetical protein